MCESHVWVWVNMEAHTNGSPKRVEEKPLELEFQGVVSWPTQVLDMNFSLCEGSKCS